MRDYDYLAQAVTFCADIGISVEIGPVAADAFLPGLQIDRGRLLVDPSSCLCLGDVLHEAGHLATVPAAVRHRISGNVDACLAQIKDEMPGRRDDPQWACVFGGGDTAAIAWSYAAALVLNLPPEKIFIQQGYGGGVGADPQALRQQLEWGFFPGIRWLARLGLTAAPVLGEVAGEGVFPQMAAWTVGDDFAGFASDGMKG